MTHQQALEFKDKPWFVRITCDLEGDYSDNYVLHVESATVVDCVLKIKSYSDVLEWAKIWD